MSKCIYRLFFLAGILVNPCFHPVYCQTVGSQTERLMFYNVENLFDTSDDTLTEDNEFLPEGVMHWNSKRYENKINSLYKTIIAAGDWEPPAIVGLCEIENRKVLEDLIYGTYLSKFNYSIIHEESPDRRGIDVCLIYRKNIASLIKYTYWLPAFTLNQKFNSRSVLYVKFGIGSDTIHLILNHWPSRRGGVLMGEDNRTLIASMIRGKIDSICNSSFSDNKIIVLGDFNCTPDDQIIKSLTYSFKPAHALCNLADSLSQKGSGTYRYMGRWEMIDQVIVTKGLLECKSGFYTDQKLFRIFKPEFLLRKDPKYPGLSPFSTYRGYKYQGGFSDHLPVIVELKIR